MKRLFIAVKLTPQEKMLETYSAIRQELSYNKIRWVEPDKFHLTLKFLGHTTVESIPIVIDIIDSVVSTESSFNIDIKNTGIFGSSYDPRIIWFGIEKNNQLVNLTKTLIDELDLAGFKKDRQNFVPHISIGRIKKLADKKLFNEQISNYRDVFLQTSIINRLILYESILTKDGPVYKEIHSVLLKL